MNQKVIIASVVVAAAIFALFVPLTRLFAAFQPMTVALSIMSAALLVRLNRGMPSLDWKAIAPTDRKQLAEAVVAVTHDYMMIVAACATLLIGLVTLTAIGENAVSLWIQPVQRGLSALVGSMATLSLARMGYVVWRDFDIVRTQKALIDLGADKDMREIEVKAATENVSDIRAANIRNVPTAPKVWDA